MIVYHIRVNDRVIDKLDTVNEAMERARLLVVALRKAGPVLWRTVEVVKVTEERIGYWLLEDEEYSI